MKRCAEGSALIFALFVLMVVMAYTVTLYRSTLLAQIGTHKRREYNQVQASAIALMHWAVAQEVFQKMIGDSNSQQYEFAAWPLNTRKTVAASVAATGAGQELHLHGTIKSSHPTQIFCVLYRDDRGICRSRDWRIS